MTEEYLDKGSRKESVLSYGIMDTLKITIIQQQQKQLKLPPTRSPKPKNTNENSVHSLINCMKGSQMKTTRIRKLHPESRARITTTTKAEPPPTFETVTESSTIFE